MGYADKSALLAASDIREEDVELPTIGLTVRVRGLPAAYSSQAQSEALELHSDDRGRQSANINTEVLESLQVLHGMVEPKLSSIEEARTFAQRCGPAFKAVVEKIDELSGVDKEAIAKANATFRAGGDGEERTAEQAAAPAGDPGPDLPVRVGA